jgi:tetratricopeptide (TPR) repeat protein
VVGSAGIGASRVVAEALADRDLPIVVFAEVADRGTPFSTARRLVEQLGGAWPATSSADPIGVASAAADEIGRMSVAIGPVIVERSHHADEASLATLRALAIVLADSDARVTVVGRQQVADGGCLRLGPLDDIDIRAIAIDASQRPLSDAELERIVTRASGNPRFAEQVARLASVADDLPVSMEALATARLDRLPRRTRELIREVAVVGPDADLHEVALILGRSNGELDLAIAAANELVTVENHRIRFHDDTVADAAAAGLPIGRRRMLHAAVVAAITRRDGVPAAQLAHHCHHAEDDAGTYRWAAQASREAMGGGASASAVVQARRALGAGVRLGRPHGELRSLAAFAADAAIAAGQGDVADRLFAQAIAAADRPAVRVDLLVRRARLARRETRLAAAAALLARARREASGKGALSVEVESCFLALHAGRNDEALRRASEAAVSARRRRWFDLEVWAMFVVEELRSNGAIDSWEPCADALLHAAHRSGDATLVARACINVALSYDNRGIWQRADELYAQAANEFSRGGEVLLHEVAQRNRASIQLELGDVDAVAEALRNSIRVFAAAGAEEDVDVTAVMLGRAEARRGGDASSIAARLRPRVHRLADRGSTDVADFQTLGLAEVQLLAGDVASALAGLEGLLERAGDYGDGHLLPISCHRLIAMAQWAAGRPDLGRSHLATARLLSSGHDMPSEELLILWAQAQIGGPLSPDDTERAEALALGLRAVSAMRMHVPDQRLARVPPGPTLSVR